MRYQRLEYRILPCNRYGVKGRPRRGAEPEAIEWYIEGTLVDDESAIASMKKHKVKFIIAANELDQQLLSDT